MKDFLLEDFQSESETRNATISEQTVNIPIKIRGRITNIQTLNIKKNKG